MKNPFKRVVKIDNKWGPVSDLLKGCLVWILLLLLAGLVLIVIWTLILKGGLWLLTEIVTTITMIVLGWLLIAEMSKRK